MKKSIAYSMTLLLMTSAMLALVVLFGMMPGNAAFAEEESVATEEETTDRVEVGEPGMVKVAASDVEDGEYDIKIDSDSGMFNITKASLTVKSGEMKALITLHGDGYKALYQGTPEEAVSDKKKDKDSYRKKFGKYVITDGDYSYEIPVPSLNTKVNVSALSKKYNKWYPHKLVFRADSLKDGAVKIDLNKNKLDVKDGEYTIDVKLEGGTGRATVTSPAAIVVEDGIATATIEWSSPNYDYMIVNGEKFLPQNQGEGNSTFEIPVTKYDEAMDVIADTTAMSVPHEIEYKLTFDKGSVKGKSPLAGMDPAMMGLVVGAVLLVLILAFITIKRRSR